MKLFYSPSSPFVRKVMACLILRGLEGQVELVSTNAHASPGALLAANPLSKVPALLTEDGAAIYDSPVICEYLDGIGSAAPLFPAGPARIPALVTQALADGLMDAAVARRMSDQLPQDEGRIAFSARQKAAVERGLAVLEQAPPQGLADIGAVAVACALGYLDFRFAQEPWREAHPKLAAWLASVAESPAITRTAPPAA
ncbi:glutathione S-transferase N-terminal domain-containing protein [Roseomonas sp. GC11]|uniref:glutathione S-transferase N-terminal domain-containing protein n=1 Tax=Roseomonas sp. GC11 TaxID=2950546 RepID=UPI00210ADA26|nr:glutathione S-transferase N-terminal domain-containing protein [Roseomonas sp. GC11]MCQ4161935.1 glutathione S-transferase N-terminal domain-containing protein [Roseomonas sp. GC11]